MCQSTKLAVVLISGLSSFAAAPQWQQENGFRWADLNVPRSGKTGFSLLPPAETGIHFTNTLDQHAGEANRVLFNGSGVAGGDRSEERRVGTEGRSRFAPAH